MAANPDVQERTAWKPDRQLFRIISVLLIADLIVIALLPLGLWAWLASVARTLPWLAVALIMAAFIGAIGLRANGLPLGALIDENNRMSLSRLQVTLWTILILSAFFAIALPRIFPGGMAALTGVKPGDPALATCQERLGNPNATAADCGESPLQVSFPPELLLAMGISVTSFAGSTLIQSSKGRRQVDLQALATTSANAGARLADADAKRKAAETASKAAESEFQQAQLALDVATNSVASARAALARAGADADRQAAQAALDQALAAQLQSQARSDAAKSDRAATAKAFEAAAADYAKAASEAQQADDQLQAGTTQAQGLLFRNNSPREASWIDLFRGAEIGNYQLIDMAKVQMFFLTLIVVAAYAAAIAALLGQVDVVQNPLGVSLPPFSPSLNTLLAISHGGYLSAKTIDHTKAAG